MTNEQRVKLWDAINRYVTACRGDPSKYLSGARMKAVAEVEATIREVETSSASTPPSGPEAETCPLCHRPEKQHPGGVYCPWPAPERRQPPAHLFAPVAGSDRCAAPGCEYKQHEHYVSLPEPATAPIRGQPPFSHQHADGRVCQPGDVCPQLGRIASGPERMKDERAAALQQRLVLVSNGQSDLTAESAEAIIDDWQRARAEETRWREAWEVDQQLKPVMETKLAHVQAERDKLLKALRYANDRLAPVESSLAAEQKRANLVEERLVQAAERAMAECIAIWKDGHRARQVFDAVLATDAACGDESPIVTPELAGLEQRLRDLEDCAHDPSGVVGEDGPDEAAGSEAARRILARVRARRSGP